MPGKIRSINQKLNSGKFSKPEDTVAWLGAVQAQNLDMVTWAIGVRTQGSKLTDILNCINQGKIVRTHILRPTWHFVAAEDLGWMMKLTGPSLQRAYVSYAKQFGLDKEFYNNGFNILEKILHGLKLTKQEITERFIQDNPKLNQDHVTLILNAAEPHFIICGSGVRNGKHTYSLTEEVCRGGHAFEGDEAICQLAQRYFRSHSPATLVDFQWWSGLTVKQCKTAIGAMKEELEEMIIGGQLYYLYRGTNTLYVEKKTILIPSYDELLISYKSRHLSLDEKYKKYAFNNFGIFKPVVYYNGRIIGNWSFDKKKKKVNCLFFEKRNVPPSKSHTLAEQEFIEFYFN